ncbi:MAG: N-acetylmuramoyl-L-alanine amidase [Saprospiraceae bacterium]
MLRTLLITSLISISFTVLSAGDNHAVAKVKSGENIELLLKRYLLTPHDCNIETFCSINNIKNKQLIYAGRIYKLPLVILDYNGKTIRSTIGNSDLELARKIEKLNMDLLKAGIRDRTYQSNNKLWVPIAEFECDENGNKSSSTPNTTEVSASESANLTELKKKGIKEIYVPMMGPNYSNVNIEDFSLAGQVFYIVSGHGGPDPGAICSECPSTMCEDEYAYDVALRLARDLMQHGATVHMIIQDKNDGIRDEEYLSCDNDELLLGKTAIPLSQKQRLRDRATTINALYRKHKKQGVKIQKAIEIHVDSRGRDKRQDVFFYYNKNNSKSKKLAETVHEVFAAKYDEHQKNRGFEGFVEDRGIYMVRSVLPDMLFVELANIRNSDDQVRLIKNTNRQALANWLFEGLRK